jgi:hypothetical protein
LEALEVHARQTLRDKVPGTFVECGVAHGGSALLLALLLKGTGESARKLWLFDTFAGLPEGSERDPDRQEHAEWVGERLRGPLPAIRALFRRFGVVDLMHPVEGMYQDTMPGLALPPIAFLHLDSDWYDSTMTCLTHMWPHITPGGYVQIDDYGSYKGCCQAVHDYFGADQPALHRIDSHGVWLRKPSGAQCH